MKSYFRTSLSSKKFARKPLNFRLNPSSTSKESNRSSLNLMQLFDSLSGAVTSLMNFGLQLNSAMSTNCLLCLTILYMYSLLFVLERLVQQLNYLKNEMQCRSAPKLKQDLIIDLA